MLKSAALAARLREARARLDQIAKLAQHAVRMNLDARRHRLTHLAASLDALSPLAVLARGYSLTFQADEKTLVRSASDVRPDDLIHTRLAFGHLISRVVSTGSSPLAG